jgi:predicted ATPase
MKITRLFLKNIRCFDELDLKFDGTSSLIIGDNGDGKSTVLRSLAMGLCDQSSAAALFRELPGEFVRRDSKGDSYIQVDLVGRRGLRYRIKTNFVALDAFERIEQAHFCAKGRGAYRSVKQDNFPWSQTFVSAYGPGIRTFGNADYSYYLPVDAVYSLFRYDAALQSPELVIRRLVDEASKRNAKRGRNTLNRLRSALAKLLNLKRAQDIELTKRGIFISGSWGRDELAALGDGYRATTTWTLDLMSWWLLYDDEPAHEFDASDLTGIVIIDELEQHLHPRWQRTILPQLRALFPQLQFIVATHSPLVASSCPDVAVHRLDSGTHTIHQPYGWRAEDVYDMMGVSTSRAETFQENVLVQRELESKVTCLTHFSPRFRLAFS